MDAFRLELPAALKRLATERRFEPHQDIFLQGQSAPELHSIVAGRVKLWRAGEDGAACALLLLGHGELIGSVAVAQNSQHLTCATALDTVTTLAWPAAAFRDAARSNPALAMTFLKAVAHRAAQLIDRFEDVAGLPVDQRIARLLLRLSGELGVPDEDLKVVLDVRQQDLAEMAQTTVPTVSRSLSAWRLRGLVEVRRGRIVVPHLANLARVAGIHLD